MRKFFLLCATFFSFFSISFSKSLNIEEAYKKDKAFLEEINFDTLNVFSVLNTVKISKKNEKLDQNLKIKKYSYNGEDSNIKINWSLPIPYSRPEVRFFISYYQKHPQEIISSLKRAQPYFKTILKIVREHGLPDEIAFLPIVESKFRIKAKSFAGAAGLWQLMPTTARYLGLKVKRYYDERYDIVKSTHAACRYLKYLYNIFGDWDLAIAAYNSGPATIKRQLKKVSYEKNVWALNKLPLETQEYVPEFYAILTLIKYAHLYGLKLPKKFESVPDIKYEVKIRTTLKDISKLFKLPYSKLLIYNAAYIKGIIPKNHIIYLTKEISQVLPSYGIIKKDSRNIYIYYKVKKGDSLWKIARKFGISVRYLKKINYLKSYRLKPGQTLLIFWIRKQTSLS